jgi:hypothetical protein
VAIEEMGPQPASCSHEPPKLGSTRKINLNMHYLVPMKGRVPINSKD